MSSRPELPPSLPGVPLLPPGASSLATSRREAEDHSLTAPLAPAVAIVSSPATAAVEEEEEEEEGVELELDQKPTSAAPSTASIAAISALLDRESQSQMTTTPSRPAETRRRAAGLGALLPSLLLAALPPPLPFLPPSSLTSAASGIGGAGTSAVTADPCPRSTARQLLPSRSHPRTVPSSPAVNSTSTLGLGWKQTAVTTPEWPWNACVQKKASVSKTRALRSAPAVARSPPEGSSAMATTGALWAFQTRRHSAVVEVTVLVFGESFGPLFLSPSSSPPPPLSGSSSPSSSSTTIVVVVVVVSLQARRARERDAA